MSDSVYDNYPAVRYVDEYERYTDPLCRRCKGNCGFIGMTGDWACQGFIPKTNRDNLNSMSNKELAEWLVLTGNGVSYENTLKWLEAECLEYANPVKCPKCGDSVSGVREHNGKKYRHCYSCHFEFPEE